jgi:hypothetical protein
MSVPVQSLNREQKAWYARLVVAAILADDEISPSEVDFLKQVIAIVDDPVKKKELLQCISTKERPTIEEPVDVPREILAAIFIELCLIMISDLEFAADEKAFLKEVAERFGFEKTYFLEVMRWAEQGLQWKTSQRQLIPQEGGDDGCPTRSNLNAEQKKWYAQALIATIMLDGSLDESELSFLKAAICFVDCKQDQKELLGYVRNKMAPKLKPPPNIPFPIRVGIFIEVMRIVSADESMSYAEHAYLKQVADLCGFNADLFNSLIEWCNRGIAWMQNKSPLISGCRLSAKRKSTPHLPEGFEINPDNSSVINRDLSCFVCDTPEKVRSFQLKPHSQEPSRNIFGIMTYLDARVGYDYIDYNRIRIIICPTCFFASLSKDLFCKGPKDKAPEILTDPKFRLPWLKDIKQRKDSFDGQMAEIGSIRRSNGFVIKSYQLAIKAADALAAVSGDDAYRWQAVTMMMTLAEIVMNLGKVAKAEEFLNLARERADDLFKHASSISQSFKAARLLLYIALYHKDIQSASPLLDFLREHYSKKMATLSAEEQSVLKKIFGETKKAIEDRTIYHKDKLIGFHQNV